MQRLELVKFLADSAAELLDRDGVTAADREARAAEAAELMNLGARILSRSETVENSIQEAA